MRAALVTEYRKVVTTRLWWVLLIAMVLYMAFLAALLAWGVSEGSGMSSTGPGGSDDLALTPEGVTRAVYTIAVTFGYVFPLVVGALTYPAELRHQTITPTFLAEPRRTVVLLAKLVSGTAVGLVFGVAGTAAAVGAGASVLSLLGRPTFLGAGSTWRTLLLSALALALWAFVGVALGTVLTNQVAVVVVVLAFTQFVEPVLRFTLAQTSWGAGVVSFLPGAAGEAVSGGSFYSESGLGELLPWWQGMLLLLGYGVLFAAIGRFTRLAQDIT
ncbi:ABC transporter permease [Cellulomonas sp. URHB0016]